MYTQIRLDDGLHGKLRAIATAEHRSLNNLMEYFLLRQVGEYEREHPALGDSPTPERDQVDDQSE